MRFPSGEDPVKVSIDGGTYPQWRRDGRELFFASPAGQMMAASIDLADAGSTPGAPLTLFEFENNVGMFDEFMPPYSVTADGERFLIGVLADVPQPPIHIILNWPALLEN